MTPKWMFRLCLMLAGLVVLAGCSVAGEQMGGAVGDPEPTTCGCEGADYVCRNTSSGEVASTEPNSSLCSQSDPQAPVCGCEQGDLVCRDQDDGDEVSRWEDVNQCQDVTCGCDGNVFYCSDDTNIPNDSRCTNITCTCSGTTLECSDGSQVPNSGQCPIVDNTTVTCFCDGAHIVCSDGTIRDECGSAPPPVCACQGADLVCNNGNTFANSPSCVTTIDEPPDDQTVCFCSGDNALRCTDGSVFFDAAACGGQVNSCPAVDEYLPVSTLSDQDEQAALSVRGPGGQVARCVFGLGAPESYGMELAEVCPAAAGRTDLQVLCLQDGAWSDDGLTCVSVTRDGSYLSFTSAVTATCGVFLTGEESTVPLAGATGGGVNVTLVISAIAVAVMGGGAALWLLRRRARA